MQRKVIMLTQTIRSTEFDKLATAVAVAGSNALAFDAIKNLAAYIDGFLVGHRRRAVEEYKALTTQRGLVLCNEKALDEVLAGSQVPRSLMQVFDSIKTDELQTQVTVDSREPEFTISNPYINAFANDTAALLSGHANQDIGISWMQSLEELEAQLSPKEEPVTTGAAFHTKIKEKLFAFAEGKAEKKYWSPPSISKITAPAGVYYEFVFLDHFWFQVATDYFASLLNNADLDSVKALGVQHLRSWTISEAIATKLDIVPPADCFKVGIL